MRSSRLPVYNDSGLNRLSRVLFRSFNYLAETAPYPRNSYDKVIAGQRAKYCQSLKVSAQAHRQRQILEAKQKEEKIEKVRLMREKELERLRKEEEERERQLQEELAQIEAARFEIMGRLREANERDKALMLEEESRPKRQKRSKRRHSSSEDEDEEGDGEAEGQDGGLNGGEDGFVVDSGEDLEAAETVAVTEDVATEDANGAEEENHEAKVCSPLLAVERTRCSNSSLRSVKGHFSAPNMSKKRCDPLIRFRPYRFSTSRL